MKKIPQEEEVISHDIYAGRLSEMRTADGPLDLTPGKALVLMNNFGGT